MAQLNVVAVGSPEEGYRGRAARGKAVVVKGKATEEGQAEARL